MQIHHDQFLKEQYIPLLEQINPHQLPHWGKMSYQHMLEHMIYSFEVSCQHQPVPDAGPLEADLPAVDGDGVFAQGGGATHAGTPFRWAGAVMLRLAARSLCPTGPMLARASSLARFHVVPFGGRYRPTTSRSAPVALSMALDTSSDFGNPCP